MFYDRRWAIARVDTCAAHASMSQSFPSNAFRTAGPRGRSAQYAARPCCSATDDGFDGPVANLLDFTDTKEVRFPPTVTPWLL